MTKESDTSKASMADTVFDDDPRGTPPVVGDLKNTLVTRLIRDSKARSGQSQTIRPSSEEKAAKANETPGPATSSSAGLARPVDARLLTERYLDLGLLGSGGMGTVRRVRDRLLNRVLAMKILHNRLLSHEGNMQRFIQEAQVCAQLQHPNILAIHDLGVLETGEVFITMTEIRGDSLQECIQQAHAATSNGQWSVGQESWNLRRLITIFHDMCKAVSYAHKHGVVHRDLKPQNVMVGPFGEVLVVDWGLAKVVSVDDAIESVVTTRSQSDAHATVAGVIYGTPAYMAPEQTSGEKQVANEQTEIYALGAILYELLKGTPAYDGKSVFEVLIKITTEDPAPFATQDPQSEGFDSTHPNFSGYTSTHGAPVPAELVEICQKAMAREPSERFETVSEMVEAVAQWLDGSRRREMAMGLMDTGRNYATDITDDQTRAQALRKEAEAMGTHIEPWQPEASKRAMWSLEDEARTLEANTLVNRTRQAQTYRAALAHKEDLPEAHLALTEHYFEIHQDAEASGDLLETRRAEVVLEEHVRALPHGSESRKHYLRYLEGTGRLSIRTIPSGSTMSLMPLIAEHRRLVPGEGSELGLSPLQNEPIAMGSYVVTIRQPGYHETIYPVHNGRMDTIDGVDPRGVERPIELLPEGTLEADDCYVPAGWCWVGGDVRTPNSGPKQRVWIDGFVIRRFPVTHAEYVSFLNDLLKQSREDEACLHAPREQSSSEGELGVMPYHRDASGIFHLPDDPHREICWPDQPVTMIQWRSARAYAQWEAQRTGRPWRLPMEFEWEKAARGVDGRAYPWGDAFDPSWACMKDSHQDDVRMQPVNTFPFDISVYGVRGTAGNTRDWCLDRFRETGPPLDDGYLVFPTAEDLADGGFKSCRGGSYGNSASRARSADRDWWFPERSYVGRGFRLAWSLSAMDESAGVKAHATRPPSD